MEKKEIVLFWSGGKDSALALYFLLQDPTIKVKSLLTTVTKETNTIAFHGVDEALIREQAKLIGIPLHRVYLPSNCSNQQYSQIIGKTLQLYTNQGIDTFAFGDIKLNDIRMYREKLLKTYNCNAVFPLWNKNIEELKVLFFQHNFRAIITSIYKDKLSSYFLGKELNQDIINQLPDGIDHFGEYGEFHTLITFAPFFKLRLQTSMSITKQETPYEIMQLRLP